MKKEKKSQKSMKQEIMDMSATPVSPETTTHHHLHQRTNQQAATPQEEINRGSTINFYAVQDPMVLAAWASFFRDQYSRTKAERDEREFLHTVETDILHSHRLETVFREFPFSDEKPFEDSCFEAIFADLSANSSSSWGHHPFDTPAWRGYLWSEGEVFLGDKIEKVRSAYRKRYTTQIRDIIDTFLENKPVGYARSQTRRELMSISFKPKDRPGPHETVKLVYALLHRSKVRPTVDVVSLVDNQEQIQQELHGKMIWDIFTVEEEAFILAVMASHLGKKKQQDNSSRNDRKYTSSSSSFSSSSESSLITDAKNLVKELDVQRTQVKEGPDASQISFLFWSPGEVMPEDSFFLENDGNLISTEDRLSGCSMDGSGGEVISNTSSCSTESNNPSPRILRPRKSKRAKTTHS